MTDKPKPLTKAEWEALRSCIGVHDTPDLNEYAAMSVALDALFAYRERTRGADMVRENCGDTWLQGADEIAAELGIE